MSVIARLSSRKRCTTDTAIVVARTGSDPEVVRLVEPSRSAPITDRCDRTVPHRQATRWSRSVAGVEPIADDGAHQDVPFLDGLRHRFAMTARYPTIGHTAATGDLEPIHGALRHAGVR